MLSPEVELYDELRKVAPEDLTRAITRYVDGTNDRKIMEKLQVVATKQDVYAMKDDIHALKVDFHILREDIVKMEARLEHSIAIRTSELAASVAATNTALERGLKDTMRWLFGFWITTMLGLAGLLISILKG